MTKRDLIEEIVRRSAAPRREVEAIVNAVFATIREALERLQRVEVRGFGSFTVRVHGARRIRDPRTGRAMGVPPRRLAHFTAGKDLRARLNASGR